MQSPAPEHGTEAHGQAPAGREAAQEKDKLGPRKIGRFTILRELGQGGFGIVYLARDPTLSRLVALKLPRLEILASPELKRRFLVEAQAAARLDHPNILPIYDVGELGPDPSMGLFIASAYCRDGSLSGWIARQHTAIAPRLAARLMLGLAQGVEHLHEQGILHRDLKPSNVLLQRSASPGRSSARSGLTAEDPVDPASIVPRIADFGLARLMDQPADQTQSGHPLGSPPYMSPEQAEGRISAMGPATDIYGLGAILYSLLVGRPPFRAETPALTIRQVIEDEPVAPRKLRPGLPRDLETICLTCLHKSPERRYASAAALREDLNRWLEGQPIHARPVSSAERAFKSARRRPAIAALSVFLFLAVTLGITGVFSQWRRAENALADALRSGEIADHHAYVSDINLASREYADGNIDHARRLLEQVSSSARPKRPAGIRVALSRAARPKRLAHARRSHARCLLRGLPSRR